MRPDRAWLHAFHAGLFNPDAPHERLWLLRARRDLEEAHRTGLVTAARMHALRAALLGRLGDLDAALHDAHVALDLDPRPQHGHYDLARTLIDTERLPEAIHLLEAVLALPRCSEAARALLAEAHRKTQTATGFEHADTRSTATRTDA